MPNDPEIFDRSVHGGYTELARTLQSLFPEKGEVTRQKVHMWAHRSERNGFPKAVSVLAPSGKIKQLFYLKDVVSWYFGYKPRTYKKRAKETVDN